MSWTRRGQLYAMLAVRTSNVIDVRENESMLAKLSTQSTRIFITGSGGGTIAEMIGAKFVQEVHAVSLAVEKLHPEVYSVIELGGQDAKIIVFKDDEETGRKKKIPSMNDKCAGGTGAVIDKIKVVIKLFLIWFRPIRVMDGPSGPFARYKKLMSQIRMFLFALVTESEHS